MGFQQTRVHLVIQHHQVPPLRRQKNPLRLGHPLSSCDRNPNLSSLNPSVALFSAHAPHLCHRPSPSLSFLDCGSPAAAFPASANPRWFRVSVRPNSFVLCNSPPLSCLRSNRYPATPLFSEPSIRTAHPPWRLVFTIQIIIDIVLFLCY